MQEGGLRRIGALDGCGGPAVHKDLVDKDRAPGLPAQYLDGAVQWHGWNVHRLLFCLARQHIMRRMSRCRRGHSEQQHEDETDSDVWSLPLLKALRLLGRLFRLLRLSCGV
ncbi:hypothetical protein Amme_010_004 [Acidomonas methanolica NBRC 104435]|uniref:Uncharacterized protein n=1 Tax=Acidomonas methanolica NBRC 104435 TaxID=1231351 RepID=A0A023D241_ACIMT|nr:hypothetical protein Amme_010_004 [Acidomonas methanolica NBRC 104435]